MRHIDFTSGPVGRKILLFSLPLMVGNIFQQLYNVVDTLVVGKFLGEAPLAAVGSAYTLMIFLTSILIGLTMGSGVYFSLCFGRKNFDRMKQAVFISFLSIGLLTVIMNGAAYLLLDELISFMQVPFEVIPYIRDYLWWILTGLLAVFLYNFGAALLRAVGDSVTPLLFLILSSLMNVALDILFVVYLDFGVSGAAEATVISQYASGAGIFIYCLFRREFHISGKDRVWSREIFWDMSKLSLLTSLQQSIMNFGILLVQGLVNSFGTTVMAAFAAGVKIDTIAYSPLQDFGNAFSTFIAQNYGAGDRERVHESIHKGLLIHLTTSALFSVIIFSGRYPMMHLFVGDDPTVIAIGAQVTALIAPCYVLFTLVEVLSATMRGVGDAVVPAAITMVFTCIVRLIYLWGYAFSHNSNLTIAVIYPISWVLTSIAFLLYYKSRKWMPKGFHF